MPVEKCRLAVRVTPRSSRNEIAGWRDDVLAVKVTAPPVEGAANKVCIELLADRLGVRKSHVALVSGAAAREKLFEITGLSRAGLRRRLGRE